MKSLNRLFGKKEKSAEDQTEPLRLIKSAEMLNEDKYWNIIGKSLIETKSQENQERYLIREIEKLTPAEIIGFRLRTDRLLYETYNPTMWCAGYIMNGGCSDDMFEYFRNWVISRGKQTYYKAKDTPDCLIDEVNDEAGFYEFEIFWYVANKAFKNRTGENLYDFIDYEKFTTSERTYPQFEFTWEEDDPDSLRELCPKVFDKLWPA